jgi:VWFA-related protein
MKKLWLLVATVMFGVPGVFSQAITPTPPNDDDVVRISTNLIQIDVSVTDKKGNIINDLRSDEIEIYENNEKQEITNFSFISNLVRDAGRSAAKEKQQNPGFPPADLKRENIKRSIALLVDDLALSHSDMYFTKQSLKTFVNKQMQDGDMIAIVRTGGGIGALQQFTNDKRRLLAAIDKLQFNMLVTSRSSAFNPLDPTLGEEGVNRDTGRTTDTVRGKTQSDNESRNAVNEFRESIYSVGTLGAINYVIRGMKDLPGRKSIMLLSPGFKLASRRIDWGVDTGRIFESLQRLIDLANRSSVVIYTIDVRGVTFDGLTAADNTNGFSDEQIQERLDDRRNETLDTQDGLRYLAKETGGLAYFQNGIDYGIRRALDDQSYYLVGYEPDPETFNPKKNRFNKIQVKVKRAGVNVRYRSGFFGFSEEQIADPKRRPDQALYDALISPFAVNDISLRLNALFVADEKRRGYLRAFLHIGAKDLTFAREPDGNYKASIDLIASTFGESGMINDGTRATHTLILKQEEYQKMLDRGVVYDFPFDLKKPGAYQVRVAIRDNATNRVGSASHFVEVPDIKKKRLALSGLLLENMAYADYQKFETLTPEEVMKLLNPLSDTAVRRFRQGSVLTFAADVFNSKRDAVGKVYLSSQARIYNENQDLVFEGKLFPKEYIPRAGTADVTARGAIRLGANFSPGNYTLQFIVTDQRAEKKRRVAAQFVPFEIAN